MEISKESSGAKGVRGKGAGVNVWQVVSLVLAVVVVVLLVLTKDGNKDFKVLKKAVAGQVFVDFVNRVYGPQVGQATLKEITEVSGLYKITIGVNVPNGPQEQIVFMTKDGLMFSAEQTMLQLSEIEKRFLEFQSQQPAASNPATDPAVTPTTENIQVEPTDEETAPVAE